MFRFRTPSNRDGGAAPKPALRDPVIGLGIAVTVTVHAWMFFAGPYLPYIDYSNHLALISVMAQGGETGALAYIDRSWAPTPYWLFYVVTAAFAQVVSVPTAGKLSLLLASAMYVLGAAWLAERTGRSPRLGLIAPLAMFGYAFGYGFASYIFAMPWALICFAATEYLLDGIDHSKKARKRTALLSGCLLVCYLGHAIIIAVTSIAVGLRIGLFSLSRLSRGAAAFRPIGAFLIAYSPVAVIALLVVGPMVWSGDVTSRQGASDRWFQFSSLSERMVRWAGDLLERGSSAHLLTMQGAFILLLVWLGLSLVWSHRDVRFDREHTGPQWGLEIYAGLFCALYFFGPVSLEKPMAVWMVYPRFAVLAAVLVFLLPRVDLSGWVRGCLAISALGLVIHNASINRQHILRFNEWAKRYDDVRKAIPKGARFLALTSPTRGDLASFHPALGSLYFYHMMDGAAYCAFLFDTPLHPVRPKVEPRPKAPPWNQVHRFDPNVHGTDYDYLVLRGARFVDILKRHTGFELVTEAHGWHVYRNRRPPPWPEGYDAPR